MLRVRSLRRFVTLNASSMPSPRTLPTILNVRLTLRFRLKKSAPMPEFRSMMKAKLRFIIPAIVFFIVYYFSLPLLVGYAPGLMSKRILGVVNIAYLFALSQFFMAWIIAALYLRAASRFDRMEHRVIEKAVREQAVRSVEGAD